MKEKVGFIGIGTMGKWMALNLMNAGYSLTVFDVNPEPMSFFVGKGAGAARNPKELSNSVDWIFLSLPNTEIVEQVLFDSNGVLDGAKQGVLIVDFSTIKYMATLRIYEKLKEKGLQFADAPVSGMEKRAKDAQLTVMFGGEKEVFDSVKPALSAIGNQTIYMGNVGSGQLTKLINQLLFNINVAGIAEILPMAVRLGLDAEKVAEVVTTGTGKSFAGDFFIPLILENRFDVGYPIESAYKDMISASEISAQQKIPLPLVNATMATFQMALASGYGQNSKGGLIQVFENFVGTKFRKNRRR
jgi:3-hydroxyisobutyrate dehydrogenase-like beta-hydroxyacid dehydrogenase